MATALSIHPAVDKGIARAGRGFRGGMLRCHCRRNAVGLRIDSQCAHNHVCGWTRYPRTSRGLNGRLAS